MGLRTLDPSQIDLRTNTVFGSFADLIVIASCSRDRMSAPSSRMAHHLYSTLSNGTVQYNMNVSASIQQIAQVLQYNTSKQPAEFSG